MWYLAFISFLLLVGYLLLMALRFGIPNMLSDTYYQLQPTTGSEIAPFKQPRNMGWIFSLIMVAVAFLMLISLLDTGMGIQFLAFLGCAADAAAGFSQSGFLKAGRAGRVFGKQLSRLSSVEVS